MGNIEQQMEDWFLSQKLCKYADELELFVSVSNDQAAKELLSAYITLVRQKAEKCDPVADVINKVKAIGGNGLLVTVTIPKREL